MNKLFRYTLSLIIALVVMNLLPDSKLIAASSLELISCDTLVLGQIGNEIKVNLDFRNKSLNVVNVKMKVNITELAPTHSFLICFPPGCFPYSKTGEQPFEGEHSMGPNTNIGNLFSCAIDADMPGTSVCTFTFFSSTDPTDFISFTATVKVLPTSVDDNKTDASSFSVTPNPASDLVRISIANAAVAGSSEIKIFDMTGNIIMTQQLAIGNPMQSVDVSALPQGIYQIAYFSNGTLNAVKKMSVVK